MKRMRLYVIVVGATAVVGYAGYRVTMRSVEWGEPASPALLFADEPVIRKLKQEGYTSIQMLGKVNWTHEGQTGFEAIAKDGRQVRGYVTSNPEPLGERIHIMQWGAIVTSGPSAPLPTSRAE